MNKQPNSGTQPRSAQGSAVIVVLVLLSIMMILVSASFVAERILGTELKQIEQKQLNRLGEHPSNHTNAPVANPAHG